MGGIVPLAKGINTIAGAVNNVGRAVGTIQTLSGSGSQRESQNLALRQLQERQALQQQQLSQSNALERERLATLSAQDEEERRAALRRAVARQRANFGSSGVSSDSGSGQAVLLGLFDETENELARREQLDNLRSRALDMGEAQSSSLNLLQATQLQERNAIKSLF